MTTRGPPSEIEMQLIFAITETNFSRLKKLIDKNKDLYIWDKIIEDFRPEDTTFLKEIIDTLFLKKDAKYVDDYGPPFNINIIKILKYFLDATDEDIFEEDVMEMLLEKRRDVYEDKIITNRNTYNKIYLDAIKLLFVNREITTFYPEDFISMISVELLYKNTDTAISIFKIFDNEGRIDEMIDEQEPDICEKLLIISSGLSNYVFTKYLLGYIKENNINNFNIDYQDENGDTAITYALNIAEGSISEEDANLNLIKLLVEEGADTSDTLKLAIEKNADNNIIDYLMSITKEKTIKNPKMIEFLNKLGNTEEEQKQNLVSFLNTVCFSEKDSFTMDEWNEFRLIDLLKIMLYNPESKEFFYISDLDINDSSIKYHCYNGRSLLTSIKTVEGNIRDGLNVADVFDPNTRDKYTEDNIKKIKDNNRINKLFGGSKKTNKTLEIYIPNNIKTIKKLNKYKKNTPFYGLQKVGILVVSKSLLKKKETKKKESTKKQPSKNKETKKKESTKKIENKKQPSKKKESTKKIENKKQPSKKKESTKKIENKKQPSKKK
jgi:hypothetical protein